jgi:hypothetical protein
MNVTLPHHVAQEIPGIMLYRNFVLVCSIFKSSYILFESVFNLSSTVIEVQSCSPPAVENLSTKNFCSLDKCNPATVNYGEWSVDISLAKPLGATKFGFYAEY